MTVEMTLSLRCNWCGRLSQLHEYVTDRVPLRRDMESLRSRAIDAHGWARRRPAGRDSFGDYCPRCLKKEPWKRRASQS